MGKETTQPREWFRHWFDDHYSLVYAHRTDAEAEDFVAHWPLPWKDLAGGRALDLGCGNGRFARAIARRDLKVLGLDLSRSQLKLARRHDFPPGRIQYLRADIRDLPLRGGFVLAANLFTSFGYFFAEEEHTRTLRNIANCLAPGGWLILDLPDRRASIRFVHESPLTTRTADGFVISEERRLSPDGLRIEKNIELCLESDSSAGEACTYRESVRLFEPDEILEMTREAGLMQAVPFWGDYQGGKYLSGGGDPRQNRMVFFGRKHG